MAEALGKPFEPEGVFIVRDLPRTRNGKIMRRIVRGAATGSALGDISSLENPKSVDEIRGAVAGRP